MKRLTLALVADSGDVSGYYLPGDTLGGHVNLLLSSSMKYTCLRIHFQGIVNTKVAKTEEQVYVLKQQVVLLGNANNATEYSLEKGQHSWPFQFTIPLQHIPSSGKYKHGAVKYSLTATMTSTGFMGGVQELKATQAILIKDLINIQVTPFSEPVSVTGSSSIKNPSSTRPKDMAMATVNLARAAYLRGQNVEIEIDLKHPSKINRSPGCYIQLVCRQNFYAGDHAKEYKDTLVSKSEPLAVNSSTNAGKILASVTIPDTALPTMNTTRIISVDYYLYILMDMRAKTGFFESKIKGKITNKLKTRLLSSPGGFQIEVPVIVGTLSDSLHIQKPSPFALVEEGSQHSDSVASFRGQSNASSPSVATSSSIMIPTIMPPLPPLPPPPKINPPISELPQYTEEEPWPRATSNIRSRSRSVGVPPASDASLPQLPHEVAGAGSLSPPIMYYTRHRGSLPHITGQHNGAPSESGQSSSSASRTNASSRSATAPAAAPPTPPRPSVTNYGWTNSPGQGQGQGSVLRNPQGYPLEKGANPPHRNIPLPINMAVEIPTAPSAVDLGLGPASPPIPLSNRQSYPSPASVMMSSSKSDEVYQEQQRLLMQQHQQRIQQQQHQQHLQQQHQQQQHQQQQHQQQQQQQHHQFVQSPTSADYSQSSSHHSQITASGSSHSSPSQTQNYFNHDHRNGTNGSAQNHGHAGQQQHQQQQQQHYQQQQYQQQQQSHKNNGKGVDHHTARNPHAITGWTVPPQSMATAPPMNYHPVPLIPLEQVASGSSVGSEGGSGGGSGGVSGGGAGHGSYQLPRPYNHHQS
ncbi:hypothetical protein BGX24_005503 [Mortierella sp. AD032]|nr:hypothetical protein BGX24_005503 [Mortierella sp. AD032]